MALFSTSNPNLSVKALLRFPARVAASTGMKVTRANGTYTFSFDYSSLVDNTGIANPALFTAMILNTTTGIYEEVPLSVFLAAQAGDVRRPIGDTDATILNTDRFVGLTAALTAPRVWTLPNPATVAGGVRITIEDEAGGISATNTLTLTGFTINGAASLILNVPRSGVVLVSNGSNAYSFDARGAQRSANLSDLTNAATARTNLGLGTAAVQNIGTSGANVPLMSTANAWTLTQTFTVAPIFSTLTGYMKGAGAGAATAAATVPATDLSGTLQAAQEPAHTGDVTNSAGSLALTIATNAVTYAKFQQVAAVSLVGNATGSLANATGLTLAAELGFSGSTVQIATNGVTYAKLQQVAANSMVANATNATANATAVAIPIVAPQGRLTLVTATPVMTTTQAAKTTVFYTPHIGNQVPIWNGGAFIPTTFAELSQATTDATKSPAAVAVNSNYDVFVWSDGGTIRATRGPAWTSDTARGTGAGTTELSRVNGLLVNTVAITNGPGAGLGTYVGSIRSNASSQIDWIFGASSAGGTAAVLNVWNAYNKVNTSTQVLDSSAEWAYTTASYRSANNSIGNRVSFLVGLSEISLKTSHTCFSQSSSASARTYAGIGLDSTSAISGIAGQNLTSGSFAGTGSTPVATYSNFAPLGFHFIQALEQGAAGATFGGTGSQGLTFEMAM